MRKIIQAILKKNSNFLTRDYFEINSLISSESVNVEKFIFNSLNKCANLIYNDLKVAFPLGDFIVNKKHLTSNGSDFRLILNVVDGLYFFQKSIPLFSISLVAQKLDTIKNEYITTEAFLFLPIQNEFFSSDEDFGLLLNNIPLKNHKIKIEDKNKKIDIIVNKNCKFIQNFDSFICYNINLALLMFATGKFNNILIFKEDNQESFEFGLFVNKRLKPSQIVRKEYICKRGLKKEVLISSNLESKFDEILDF